MGLLDILNGMQNGPRGQRQPDSGAGGGMSPMTMALLGLLAYKAFKSFGSSGQPTQTAPGGTVASGNPGGEGLGGGGLGGGGLGDILGGLFGGGSPSSKTGGDKPAFDLSSLGGLLGGGAAGSLLSSGLGSLIKDFQNSGQSGVAQSWVGTGPNQQIAPDKLEAALGPDTLETLIRQTGLDRNTLLAGLSQHLPGLVDQLTPHGRLPSEEEASRMG